jgi:shikimate kinase
MSRHLFLIGFMGAGKSRVARLVAERLGRPFVDLDASIERRAGAPVAVIFAESGEAEFRRLESEELAGVAEREPSVIACGGGIVVRCENRTLLPSLGYVVYLKVTVGEALARVGDAATRPLLAGPAGPLAATALLQAREGLYASTADAAVDTVGRTPEAIADEVVALFRSSEDQ